MVGQLSAEYDSAFLWLAHCPDGRNALIEGGLFRGEGPWLAYHVLAGPIIYPATGKY